MALTDRQQVADSMLCPRHRGHCWVFRSVHAVLLAEPRLPREIGAPLEVAQGGPPEPAELLRAAAA